MHDHIAEVTEYFKSNCKGGDMGAVALTMYHFVLDEDGDAVPFIEKNDRLGLSGIMEKLHVFYPHEVRNDAGKIIAAGSQMAAVSLDYGGQLVISISPMLTIAQIEAEYREFLLRVEQILRPVDYELVPCGFNPALAVKDLQLIPFKPYKEVFGRMGVKAMPLLLGSARCRIAFQYASEKDAIMKLRVAALMGPIFAFIAENSSVYDKEGNGDPMLGLSLTRKAAPGLAGVVPGLFDQDFGFKQYAQWLVDNDLADEDGSPIREMILDVDLANHIELVQADALPLVPMLGYLALLKGIFYSPTTLEMLDIMLKLDRANDYNDSTVDETIEAIRNEGGSAMAYGNTVDSWVDLLFRMASQSLGTEASYLEDLQEYKGF